MCKNGAALLLQNKIHKEALIWSVFGSDMGLL